MSPRDTVPEPPVAPRRIVVSAHHGDRREDPYAWLKDPNWQQVMHDPAALDPEIRAYLEAENAYTQAAMADTEALQTALVAEMRGRIKEDDSSVPAPDGPHAYYMRYREGGQHPLFCRDDDDVLLDGDREAEGHDYFRIAACDHSPDHRHLAWAADTTGGSYMTLRVRDLTTGADLADSIVHAQGDLAWTADSAALFYTLLDDKHRPVWVRRHAVGDAGDDADVYTEPDRGFFVGVDTTASRAFVVIAANDHETSECRLIPTAAPETPPRLVAARDTGIEYEVEHDAPRERLLILTNADGAEDFKIVVAPLGAPGRNNWQDLVPHTPGTLIRAMVAFRDWLVRLERIDGLPRIVVRQLETGAEHTIAFDEEVYELGLAPGYEYATDVLRFTYSSPTTPSQVFDYDMGTRARTLRKTQEVPSGHDPADYVARRLMAPSHDGAEVPVTVLYRRDTPLDGSAPLLLYGYGSYGHTVPSGFATNRLSLVDRGFVYALAHIRGGKEKGDRWYRDGRLEKKVNTFHDFIAAAEALIAADYTRAGRIVGHGASAGGLLMGAVANMAPQLFGGIVAEVPFVDVLTTMCDDTLPLTPPEWPEWGNPIANPEAYAWIKAYSPIDNVAAKAYPAILATGGLTDPQVTYWEPAKWVATLRATKTDANPLLLKTNMAAGHAGAAGRFDKLTEVALAYAFALKVAGVV